MPARVLFIFLIVFSVCSAQKPGWSFLNTSRIGAQDFLRQNPNGDGRGTLIVILDSGIDCGAPGLVMLPDSSKKIIDVEDFSGEGDVYLDFAEQQSENEEKYLETGDGLRLYGIDLLALPVRDSVFYIGALDEKRFRNTNVTDINLNNRNDDRFGVVIFQNDESGVWQALVDLDADGQLHDESIMSDYSISREAFTFRSSGKRYSQYPLNFALKIYPEKQKVNFHFDANGHGTHVAGIAAGYRINGQEGLDGIAPGAQLLSLKIGDNSLSGGSTITGSMNDALEHAMEYARDFDGPVILNMSYGIGSAEEGRALMEYRINAMLEDNPNIVMCISAANEGPGLSTVGLPAAAERAITVGALNTADNARDIYGAPALDRDVVFQFSSRGGEVFKPDVLAPGAASSAVPPYSYRENKWGTSMASPQVAGAAALILSAFDDASDILAWQVKKALRFSAKPLTDVTVLDQGRGVVDVPAAYRLLRAYVSQKDTMHSGYSVRTLSPFFRDESGPAGYWRLGGYFPQKDDPQTLYINPQFRQALTVDSKKDFYRAFRLESSAPWLKTIQKNVYMKGTSPAVFDAYCLPGALTEPGLYSATITGYEKGGLFSSNSPENAAFDLSYTVIIPYRHNAENGYQTSLPDVPLAPGEIRRIFVDVPPAASSFAAELRSKSDNISITAYSFDPYGRQVNDAVTLDTRYRDEALLRLNDEELMPGIWEIVLYASFQNSRDARCDISVSSGGLESNPPVIRDIQIPVGQDASGHVLVNNLFGVPYKALMQGALEGIVKEQSITSDESIYQYSFTVGSSIKTVKFHFALDEADFQRITDFSLNIKDFEGNSLEKDALTYNEIDMEFSPPYSGSFILEMVPAFVNDEDLSWQAGLEEKHIFFDQPRIQRQYVNFYPNVEKDVYFFFDKEIPRTPDGFQLFGSFILNNIGNSGLQTVVPVKLD